MPSRLDWDPAFELGHAPLDEQHRQLIALCNQLADACEAAPGGDGEQVFDGGYARLKALVREHAAAEAAALAAGGCPDLEDHRVEFEEFEYLGDDIATAEHFDRPELQQFVAVWCLGHVLGTAGRWRTWLAPIAPSPGDVDPRPDGAPDA